jgi:hypothetical protein
LPFEVDIASLFHRADLHRTRGATLVRRGKELDAVEKPCRVPRSKAS